MDGPSVPTRMRWLVPGDEELIRHAGHLFDELPRRAWSTSFLAQPGHHLCIAYVADDPVGFVTGVVLAPLGSR